ncbi:MAG TPA: DUF308 domain-containing protein [Sphingomicrobium sp.]|nr:DUF308 domain-containing protein [Sphingomicrobium sp.]
MNDRTRAQLIMLAGLAIIALGIGSALLPASNGVRGSAVIGLLLCVAGIFEILAGTLRGDVKPYAIAAGGVTLLAGVLFLLNPTERFFSTVTPIIGWLVLRSGILAYASQHTGGSVRMWTGLSAGLDFLLALLLIAGLSIATLVVSVFGPTPPLIASFSWVLAASFVVTGSLLLEVANCERSAL